MAFSHLGEISLQSDCRTRDSISLCGPVRSVVNLTSVPVRIEGWYEQINSWAPLIPRVEPTSEYAPFAGALWIPKKVILRSVNLVNDTPLTVFGAVGNGITLIQATAESTPEGTFVSNCDLPDNQDANVPSVHIVRPGDGVET